MSRYRGPKLRIIRRLGQLPGFTSKISKKTVLPGQQMSSSPKKSSQFSVRLKEKQKLRFHYGITERQLLNYVKKARKKKGSSGKILLSFLEMRLDNIVFRLNFTKSIVSARQLISHGHIFVNGKCVDVPSFSCQPKNIITVCSSLKSKKIVKNNLMSLDTPILPQHLSLNKESLEAEVLSIVNRKSISLLVNELLVVEYYSRKV
jgi:small subunit ribosomal protein S4